MIRRVPLILGLIAALATLLVVGPVGLAMALLRSSPEAAGPALAAQIFIGVLVLALAALAGFLVWGATSLLVRLLRGGRA